MKKSLVLLVLIILLTGCAIAEDAHGTWYRFVSPDESVELFIPAIWKPMESTEEDDFIVHSFTDGSGVLYAGVLMRNIPDLLNTPDAEIEQTDCNGLPVYVLSTEQNGVSGAVLAYPGQGGLLYVCGISRKGSAISEADMALLYTLRPADANEERIVEIMFGKNGNGKKNESSSQGIIDFMIATAEICMEQGDFSRAVQTYQQIVELQPDVTAMYNLGSLYAQGKGVEQNYLEGAYWFHQAALAGDEQAGKLETKCMMDFIHQNLDQKTPRAVYDEMLGFAYSLYPREDTQKIASSNLYSLAAYHFNKREFATAAKLFRGAAEYGNDGESQNYLAVLYNAGFGVEKDDTAALYWFDRAVDNGVEVSKQDRDGIFLAYQKNCSAAEFYDVMQTLSRRCMTGDKDIPRDAQKAAYWRSVAEGKASPVAGE